MDLLALYVQLDPALQEIINLVVLFAVSFLFLQLASLSKPLADYLGQYKAGIVVWLTGIAIQLLQAQLDRIPANWDEVVFLAQKLIVEVILVLMGFAAFRFVKTKGYQALS